MERNSAEWHVRRLSSLKTLRAPFEAQWEEAAARIIPADRNTFVSPAGGGMLIRGTKKTDLMYDATAALAAMRFAAVIESISTPQNQLWHKLRINDPMLDKNRQVRAYMEQLNDIVYKARYAPRANFIGQSQKVYSGYGVYGNGSLFTDGQPDGNGLRYRNLHLGETYFIENHQGIIDTMYRSFTLRPQQIVDQFGTKNVPDSIMRKLEMPSQQDENIECLHIIYPRDRFDPFSLNPKEFPFASMYYLVMDKVQLEESGYRTWPLPYTRYMQFANETYGRGPAQLVLPSIKVLNEEKKTVLKQGHRTVDPVLLAFDDGQVGSFSMRNGAFNTGGVNAQGRPLVHPLPVGNLTIGQELMQDERNVINDAFLLTLFQILVQNHTMSATEALERAREKGMLLAPTAGRQQSEFLGPLIHREIDVLDQQGKIPPPPAILAQAGAEYTIEYDNPMSRMARSERAAGFMRSYDTAMQVAAATGDPSMLDWHDVDAATPELMDIYGSPVTWIRSPEAVQKIRDQRAQQQQQQQQTDNAPAAASVMKTMQGMNK